ncbi:FCD domain-containing protein [Rhodobacteraceae bacterium 2CG4]|uniref:FCD domain-containing protein n=1 Tax=Halovulum marinum TaxID=2662447 RepID=A0A6L5Z073_9RHOB|nr:FadR/GntR family transcriptional regulator [Halovulum marinum]MSU89502.1 FCD domain-containing protein [Halovulum marinum]
MTGTASRSGGRTLVASTTEALRRQIDSGRYRPGDRLPSEARLTAEFNVSRTVVREAIATLRADRLVEPRQGAGVFVLPPPEPVALPFRTVDPARVSSMIEMLELRTAVECEAAALAAQRRSPSQEVAILEALQAVRARAAAGQPTAEADFELHLAIADATNNPRFREFLTLIGPGMIPRRALDASSPGPDPAAYQRVLDEEHERIVAAILEGAEEAARLAMRDHLRGSQARYRRLLRQTAPPGP